MDLKQELDFLIKRKEVLDKWIEATKKHTRGEIVRNSYKIIENAIGIFDYIITTDNNLIQRLEDKQIEIPKREELPQLSLTPTSESTKLWTPQENPELIETGQDDETWFDRYKQKVSWKLVLAVVIILILIYYVYTDSANTSPILELKNLTG